MGLQEIVEKAGKRNYEEECSLIARLQNTYNEESRAGKGKLGNNIPETATGTHGRTPFVDGGIAYLPAHGSAVFIGDTHGDSLATEAVLRQTGFVERMEAGQTDLFLVFLGDYIDRGQRDIRNLDLVLSLKEHFPGNTILMRGNHEGGGGFRPYNFPDSLRDSFGLTWEDMHERYVGLFQRFTNIVVTANGIVAVHGGVPVTQVDGLKKLQEDADIQDILGEIRWNDPSNQTLYFEAGRDSRSSKFGRKIFDRFMDVIGGKVMVRGHEYPQMGYELFFDDRLVTIFSNGVGSRESYYVKYEIQPKLMQVSLTDPITRIDPSRHIRPLLYS